MDNRKASNAANGTLDDDTRAIIGSLIPQYLNNRKEEISTFLEAIAKLDFEKLQILGHQYRGHGPSYGFPQLGLLGQKIEDAAKSEKLEILNECVEDLKQFLADRES